jgi:hypothetical protein
MTPERLREIQERKFEECKFDRQFGIYVEYVNRLADYARQDIPDLLAEVARLRAELAEAYERAAKECDRQGYRYGSAVHAATAIRKLGETP